MTFRDAAKGAITVGRELDAVISDALGSFSNLGMDLRRRRRRLSVVELVPEFPVKEAGMWVSNSLAIDTYVTAEAQLSENKA